MQRVNTGAVTLASKAVGVNVSVKEKRTTVKPCEIPKNSQQQLCHLNNCYLKG